MPSSSQSPSSSPARKRQRLSSPTYDEQIENFCPQDLQALEELDATFSQESPSRRARQHGSPSSSPRRRRAPNALHTTFKPPFFTSTIPPSRPSITSRGNLEDDPENPFADNRIVSKPVGFASAIDLQAPALFTRGKALLADPSLNRSRSPTPEEQQSRDFSDWFDSHTQIPTGSVGFQTFSVAAVAPGAKVKPTEPTEMSISVGRNIIIPSAAAIAKAAQMLKDLEDDLQQDPREEDILPQLPPIPKPPSPVPSQSATTSFTTPQLNFSRPAGRLSVSATPSATPSQPRMRPARFRSPLIVKNNSVTDGLTQNTPTTYGSLLNPTHTRGLIPTSSQSMRSETPSRPSYTQHTPASKHSNRAPKFVTPFKPGMRPEDPTRTLLLQTASQQSPSPFNPASPKHPSQENRPTTSNKRKSQNVLETCGSRPQSYTKEELEDMSIDVAMLMKINLKTGQYYSFNTPEGQFGLDTAIQIFKERGYSVPKGWIKNHWNLILWKLAGMVALEPERERDQAHGRWSWDEALRQLIHRYEREIKGGARPPFQLITTQDAPPTSPMVLCISDIKWKQTEPDEKGHTIEQYPELEVTDGWYLLRAQIDAPLARAIRRGLIRVGRKIIVIGAKLESERKEPSEPLEAYNSVYLRLNGNSTQMAPWHARLGFHRGPFISTMHSLDPDGGLITLMDLVVVKVHPLAFIEFFDDPKRSQSSPRNEADEAKAQAQWQRKREDQESRAREAFLKRIDKWERLLERCEQKARGKTINHSEDMPSKIEVLYDELDESTNHGHLFSTLDASMAAWLAHYIRIRINKDRESAGDAIADEVNETCPPRDVRSFRVLEVQDARSCKRPANRTAQLTVWDVLSVTLTEGGKAGHFVPGDRFLATNLGPTNKGSWMNSGDNPYIYMRTNRSSRYTRIRVGA